MNLHSNNSHLNELASLVNSLQPDDTKPIGSLLTNKVVSVFGKLKEAQGSYHQNIPQRTKMQADVQHLKDKILELSCAKDAWSDDEKKQGLPQKLKQGLDALTKIVSSKVDLLDDLEQFYHGDILKKAIAALPKADKIGETLTSRDMIRKFIDDTLKTNLNKDSKAHYLLRESSTQPTTPGVESITLSFIDLKGDINHQLFTYVHETKMWIDNKNELQSLNLKSLIIRVVGEDSLGIRAN